MATHTPGDAVSHRTPSHRISSVCFSVRKNMRGNHDLRVVYMQIKPNCWRDSSSKEGRSTPKC